MRAYKGLHKDTDGTLFCKDKIYEPGKTYKYDGKIVICEQGFHACHEPHQIWPYYPNNGENVFYEVECGGDIVESDVCDDKFVCSEIMLVKEIDMSNVAKFDNAWSFFEGFAMVELNGKYNFIDTGGKLLSERWFDNAWGFSEGFAMVELNGKCNFINIEGKLLSEQWFDDAMHFCEGFAVVKLNDKWNFINTDVKLLSEQWFDDAWVFLGRFADVKLNGKWMKIDKKGEFVEE